MPAPTGVSLSRRRFATLTAACLAAVAAAGPALAGWTPGKAPAPAPTGPGATPLYAFHDVTPAPPTPNTTFSVWSALGWDALGGGIAAGTLPGLDLLYPGVVAEHAHVWDLRPILNPEVVSAGPVPLVRDIHPYALTGDPRDYDGPGGVYRSEARAVSADGASAAGIYSYPGRAPRAVRWDGLGTAAERAVNLHPYHLFSGWSYAQVASAGEGADGGVTVGRVTAAHLTEVGWEPVCHAVVWPSASALSMLDLHPGVAGLPDGYTLSEALAVQGGVAVGSATALGSEEEGTNLRTHALRWGAPGAGAAAITPESVVNIHPSHLLDRDGVPFPGYGSSSSAASVHGTVAVGYGSGPATGWRKHALRWDFAADSWTAVDLHPMALVGTSGHSEAISTCGGRAVGYATDEQDGYRQVPILWEGLKAMDLTPFFPAGFSGVHPRSVDAAGNVMGYAYDGVNRRHVAFLLRRSKQLPR